MAPPGGAIHVSERVTRSVASPGDAPPDSRLRCHTQMTPPGGAIHVSERVTRIELAYSAWEADVLPLNYTRESVSSYR
ncbi:MAG: hypothetical protein GM44_4810 [actinobacterium acAMD-2]|nr:MAG: hypothetical protein GM44_4810 [actinobacterium acAMD-2]